MDKPAPLETIPGDEFSNKHDFITGVWFDMRYTALATEPKLSPIFVKSQPQPRLRPSHLLPRGRYCGSKTAAIRRFFPLCKAAV